MYLLLILNRFQTLIWCFIADLEQRYIGSETGLIDFHFLPLFSTFSFALILKKGQPNLGCIKPMTFEICLEELYRKTEQNSYPWVDT